ncbi:ABC transporter permease [Hazenella coriacea]|uniref:ABC-2 type transport system permease protein n=1 Tax=Hazenella coriacea TaxID=1179467 RepID=A0A4R3L427_9BACL|nr:ABC transporter permease subunit [Hazenella coriacea]TCS93675.1 ABC-2 type transport system permease protein [Hazenella coriacea]
MQFLNLIQNENMKIYRRISSWIIVGLLLVAVLLLVFMYSPNNSSTESADWKQGLQTSIDKEKKDLEKNGDQLGPEFVQMIQQNIAIDEYRIQHDLKPSPSNQLLQDSKDFMMLITLGVIIIGSMVVSSEFSWGTIKLLAIRPYHRYKLLLAKYLAMLLYTALLVVILFIITVVFAGLFFGFEGLFQNVLLFENGQVVEKPVLPLLFQGYGLGLIDLLMMSTLAFMISVVFRSQSLAIGIALGLLFMGNTITLFIASKYEWAKYILFANDLKQYLPGREPLFPDMTIGFSVTLLVIYYVVFIGITWLVFQKRDITA